VAKVCIVGPSKRFFSGISAYTICLANALSKGNDTSALLLRNLLPKFLYPGKGQIDRTDHSLWFAPGILSFDGMDWNSPLSWIRAYRFLKQQKTDVIIMQWWTSSVAHMQLFLAIANRLKIKAKLILEMHEIVDPLEERILPIRLYSRIMGRLLMRRADAFVVHASSVKDQVTRIYGLKEDSVSVIPRPLYDVYYQNCNKQAARDKLGISDEFVILYFGLIRKYKGVPYLVEAFNKLPRDIALHSRLVIVGEDWGDEPSLDDTIRASSYKGQITFKPEFVPLAEVPQYFSAADVVVLPYLRSASSGVATIAVAYGKPIIISDIEALRASVTDYEGAMFTPVGDSAAIAERLMQIYGERKSGKPLIYSHPQSTWDAVAKRYELIFARLEVGK
jgi:glycosyltransferase involved in cell wall biosynthesis